MLTINHDIEEGTFRTVYLLYGEETYLKNQYRDKLVEAMVQKDDTMNFTRFDGHHTDPAAIISIADTVPFLADRRVVLVCDSGFFKGGTLEKLSQYIKQIPETTCLIFSEREVDKRSRMYKAVKAAGYAAEFKVPDDRQLLMWISLLTDKAGKKITVSAANHFMDMMPRDMSYIHSEMEKLISYTGTRTVISNEDIDQVCCVQPENRIYKMVEAIASGNRKETVRLYHDLLAVKEEPIRIIYHINRQFSELWKVSSYLNRGYSYSQIAQETGLRDFVVKKDARLCRKFSRAYIIRAMNYGASMEQDIKTGRINKTVGVEMMLIGLTSK